MILRVATALAEGALSGVFAGAVLVWFYNRFLAGLRESYAKKAMSLATIPLAAAAGAGHSVAVLAGWPHSGIPVVAGLVVVALRARTALRQRRLNRALERRPLDVGTHGLNWRRYHPLVRAGLRLLRPVNGVDRVERVEMDAYIDGLHCDLDGFRILHLTDFHVHPTLRRRWFRAVVEAGLELRPDAVLLGGDYVSRRWHARNAAAALEPILTFGGPVFAIRGNHDFWTRPRYFAAMLHRLGASVLTNDAVSIHRGAGRLWLVGIEAPYVPLTPAATAALEARMAADPAPRIALVHTPEAFPHAAALRCSLALAGHTHGGQIRLPFFGTTIAACPAAAEHTWGAGRLGAMTTLVSNGIGAFFPLRVLCPPQVVVVTLRRR